MYKRTYSSSFTRLLFKKLKVVNEDKGKIAVSWIGASDF